MKEIDEVIEGHGGGVKTVKFFFLKRGLYDSKEGAMSMKIQKYFCTKRVGLLHKISQITFLKNRRKK